MARKQHKSQLCNIIELSEYIFLDNLSIFNILLNTNFVRLLTISTFTLSSDHGKQ